MKKDEKYKNEFTPEQRKWIDALKSGKYKKTRGTLMNLTKKNEPKGYCCLGVYCFISNQKWRVGNSKAIFGKYQDTELNNTQTRKLKLYSSLGGLLTDVSFKKRKLGRNKDYSFNALAEINDSEDITMSLVDIGKWIEANPHAVFKNFEEVK